MRLDECLGDVLRAARKERGLSQEKLALAAEVERNYISLIELGRHSVSIRVLYQICRVLEVQPSVVLAQVEDQIRLGQRKRPAKR
jgi:transcriptional regulator with XRE-family HTH domain